MPVLPASWILSCLAFCHPFALLPPFPTPCDSIPVKACTYCTCSSYRSSVHVLVETSLLKRRCKYALQLGHYWANAQYLCQSKSEPGLHSKHLKMFPCSRAIIVKGCLTSAVVQERNILYISSHYISALLIKTSGAEERQFSAQLH